jgi:hypothetical protein
MDASTDRSVVLRHLSLLTKEYVATLRHTQNGHTSYTAQSVRGGRVGDAICRDRLHRIKKTLNLDPTGPPFYSPPDQEQRK